MYDISSVNAHNALAVGIMKVKQSSAQSDIRWVTVAV